MGGSADLSREQGSNSAAPLYPVLSEPQTQTVKKHSTQGLPETSMGELVLRIKKLQLE